MIGFLARAGAVAAAVSAVTGLLLLPSIGFTAPLSLIFSATLVLLIVRRAAREVAEPAEIRTDDLVRAQSGPNHARRAADTEADDRRGGRRRHLDVLDAHLSDGVSRAVRRWQTRLDWSATEHQRFQRRVPGLLGELVDERLRQHHGLTRATDPARARALCGAVLWSFLHDELTHLPTPREVAALVDTMESL